MDTALLRTRTLLGDDAMQRLFHARVAVFGIGGVGAACAEALVRSGIGHIVLIDPDTVNESNRNRQLIALCSTVGMNKAEAMRARARDIMPECDVQAYPVFYDEGNADTFDFSEYDYIADCIDTVKSKLLIITRGAAAGTPVISALGTGNKLHPEMLKISDIYETSVCPLARVVRSLCRKNGIERLPVVWSDEEPCHVTVGDENGRHPPASCAFVPNAAGFMMASRIVRDLIA